jgi:glycosyltransferase involved in cell wall biosynthesis
MAAGLPAVILSHQGVEEISTEATAIRVPPAAPEVVIEQLAAGLLRLAGSRELRRELGCQARARIAAEYDWDRKGEAMEALYREVLGS